MARKKGMSRFTYSFLVWGYANMRKVKVAATQMSCSSNIEENIQKAEKLVKEAASKGAQIILLQELFETPYFCQKKKKSFINML